MGTQVVVTIESAGVTDYAVGHTEAGRRVVVQQPSVGERLGAGDRVLVDATSPRRTR